MPGWSKSLKSVPVGCCAGGASAIFLHVSAVLAQSAAPPAAPPAPQSGALEEITVTARKREENVQNVPVAVTAISQAQLERYDLTSLESIAATTPELNVVRGSSGSGADLSLRGIGSTFTSVGIEQSVAIDVDGVYYGQGRVINDAFFDMKDVEILKGPQALFFGKNASAGVVSVTTADPGSRFEALARYGYEEKAQQSIFEGVISGPVTDNFGLRLAVHGDYMSGGYVTNTAPATVFHTLDLATFAAADHPDPPAARNTPGQHDLAGRLTAKWSPGDRLTIVGKVSADQYYVNDATWNQVLWNCPLGHSQVNPTQACARDWVMQNNAVPADIAATNPILNRHGGQLYQDYNSYAASGTVTYDLPTVTLSSVTGYHQFVNYFLGDYDVTGASNGGTWGAERSDYNAISSELRAQTKLSGPLNFMGGLYYQSTALDFHQNVLFPGGFANSAATDPANRYVTLVKLSRTDGATWSFFGQLIYDFTPDWELTAGARYTDESKKSYFYQPYVLPAYQAVFVQGTPITGNQVFVNWSPEAMLTWKASRDMTVYGGYKQGFKSGGFSGSALNSIGTQPGDLMFRPEIARGFEGGIKSTWLDDHLRVNFDVFAYRYGDFQVDYFDSVHINFITNNVGEATTQGAELDVDWALTQVPGLVLHASTAYDVAKYESFPNAPCYGGQTPAQGCTIAANGRAVQNLSGAPTQNSPRWVGSLEGRYSWPVAGTLEGAVSVVGHFSSDTQIAPFGNPVDRQTAYQTVDATLSLGAQSDRWQVAIIGKNLTNRFVLNYAQDAPSTGSGTGTAAGVPADQLGTPILPRTVEVQVTARF